MNNSESRLHDVFFYGLYMDPEILRSKSVEPRNPRLGWVNDYELRVGNLATLLRKPNAQVYGLVYALTHKEIDLLYSKSGLDMYASEALLVELNSGEVIPAICSNLISPPNESESNKEYTAKLLQCMKKLNVPVNCL